MFELVIKNKDVETPVYVAEDKRMIELLRQRHARSLSEGEAIVRDFKPKKGK